MRRNAIRADLDALADQLAGLEAECEALTATHEAVDQEVRPGSVKQA